MRSGGLRAGGAAGLGGTQRGGVTGVMRGGETTPGAAEMPEFIPGQDGNLYWNTTLPIGERPIIVYLYNGHEADDKNAKFCEHVEKEVFKDRKVRLGARDFICEKICFGCKELEMNVSSRAALNKYLDTFKKNPEATKSRIAFLTSTGHVLEEFTKPVKPAKFGRAMRNALKENQLARQATASEE